MMIALISPIAALGERVGAVWNALRGAVSRIGRRTTGQPAIGDPVTTSGPSRKSKQRRETSRVFPASTSPRQRAKEIR
jgi:hypothetical protein